MSASAFSFTVFGDPKGQPRQRHFARKMGSKFVARSYDPGTAEGWKSAIASAAREVGLEGSALVGPVRLTMACHFARPKSHFRTGKNAHLLREGVAGWHVGKPDLDNVVKAVKDALTQIGAWKDDSQVCRCICSKRYTEGAAHTVFEIAVLDEEAA